MKIKTSRLGPIDVDEKTLITFPDGILGFPEKKQYALIQLSRSFYGLQSVDDPNLAFVVTDPRNFLPYYNPLKNTSCDGDSQLLVTVNNIDGNVLTGNLMEPIVLDADGTARQIVSKGDYKTRDPIATISESGLVRRLESTLGTIN